ncbi:MAG: tail fiber domain-containing protein [Bacteroidia bacterium]
MKNTIIKSLLAIFPACFFTIPAFAQLNVDASNNVGIGTSSPTAALDVASGNIFIDKASANNAIKITRSTSSFGASLNISTSTTNDWIIGERGTSSSDLKIYSYGASKDVVWIDRSLGNVGIGTTSTPALQLELSTNSAGKPTSSTWTITSDRRVKKDFAQFSDGLNVLRQINPVTYKYNGLAHTPVDEQGIGIIAQDMQEIAPYTVKEISRTLSPEEISTFPGDISTATVAIDSAHTEQVTKGTILGFDAHPLFFVLINAVKELDSTVTALKAQLAGARTTNTDPQRSLETTTNIELANNTQAILYQNEPNPFDGSTVIRYYIPDYLAGPAFIVFYDMYGKEINKIEIKEKGLGKIEANTANLVNGIYSYSIFINSKIIDTKRMVKQQ